MRFLSLFSGIEAASVAWHPLGWECAAFSEIEAFPCALLAYRYPSVPNLGDITKITEDQIKALGRLDVIVFGSPCQDLSMAGKRKGLINADGTVTRSGLFFAAFNIFQWARKHCGARFALWENVAGAYSSNSGQDFAAVVSYMAGLDDVAPPPIGWGKEGCALGDNGLLEWVCLDAQWFGVAQRRRRVFAVLDTGNWQGRPPILLERESLRGNSPPSRSAQGDASTILGSSVKVGSHWDHGLNPHPSLSQSHNAGGIGQSNQEVFSQRGAGLVGCYRLVAFGEYSDDGSASTMKARDFKDATDLVAYAFAENSRGELRLEGGDGQRTGALSTGGGKPGQGHPTIAYGISGNWIGRAPENGGNAVEPMHNVSPCLTATDRHGVAYYFGVRRLTPVECERLQGFPDNYTYVPFKLKFVGNGARYKALGNSMAVPVMAWIGRQIQRAVEYSA